MRFGGETAGRNVGYARLWLRACVGWALTNIRREGFAALVNTGHWGRDHTRRAQRRWEISFR